MPPEPVPASAAQTLASRLTDIIRAAPELRYSPGMVYLLASHPGDHVENAQQVAGVAKSHAIEHGARRVAHGVGPDSLPTAEQLDPRAFGTRIPGGPGLFGQFEQAAGTVVGAVAQAPSDVVHYFTPSIRPEPASQFASQVVTGSTPNLGAGVAAPIAGTHAPAGPAPGVATVQANVQPAVAQAIEPVIQQANPNAVLQMPSHIYRYLYDVRARHGNAAMVEAAIPLIGGMAAGYALTHSAQGAEDVGAVATEAVGAAGTAATGAKAADMASGVATATEAPALPASAATGAAARSATRIVLSPAVAALRAPIQAATAISTSPVALGGEATAMVSGHVIYPESWQRTADATTWKLPNGQIGPTFGQTVAGAAGLSKGSTLYNAISGSLDAVMAIAVPDPVGAAGRVYGKATSAEGLGGYLGQRWGGTAPMTAEGVAAADLQYPRVRHAFTDMAGLSQGQIVAKYPQFAGLADQLGAASTHDQVLEVFQDAARTQEILTTSELPKLGSYSRAKNVARSTTTLGTPAPTAYDADLQKFVGRTIPMNSPEAAPAVYAMLRSSGESRRVAEQVAAVISDTRDPYINITAAKNATKALIGRKIIAALPRGAPADFKAMTIEKMNDGVDQLFGGGGAGRTGQFGRAQSGADLSRVYADGEEDKSYAAAIWFNQADQMTIPSVREIRQLILDLAQMEQWTAKNAILSRGLAWESFVDHTINERIFQPLALATGGWAVRVSASEMAMNILRLGPLNFTAAKIADSAAKQNWKLATVEMPHFVAAVRGVLAGIDESAVKALGKDRILDAATASAKMFNGHVVHPGLDSTHTPIARGTDMPAIAESDIRARNRRIGAAPVYKIKGRPLDDSYGLMAPGGTGYFRSWSEYAGRIAHDRFGEQVAGFYKAAIDAGLNEKEASAMAVRQSTRWLDAQPRAEIDHMVRNHARSVAGREAGLTTHEDWAIQAVTALKGALYGGDGTFHAALLNDIVDKTVPDVRTMTQTYGSMDAAKLPQAMPGREVSHNVLNPITYLTNTLHSHILGPIVNTLSREPTWVVDFANERKLLEKKVALGEMTQDQADVLAATRAIHKSVRFVHNPLDRLKIENMLHTFAPFYFAQNQALRRAGRLFATNPGAFEQYLKAGLAVNTMATQVANRNGFPTAVIPGSTISGEGITATLHMMGINPARAYPIGLTGATDVSTTVDPFSVGASDIQGPTGPVISALKPSWGPVATIPLRALEDFFSARAPTVSADIAKVIGPVGNSQPFWMQGVPNSFAQKFIEGIIGYFTEGDHNGGSAYTSNLLSVMAAMAANGALPSAKDLQGGGYPNNSPAKAAFIKKANNQMAILWMGRMLASFFSPVSVSLGQAGLQFTDMAQSYINKAGGNVSKGLEAMTKAHPDLVPYEVFKSTASDGYSYPEVQQTAAWIEANRSLVTKWPAAARWLVPNYDTKGRFSDSAYQMELAMGLRAKLTPSEFFDQIYIASGNAWYFDNLEPQIKAAIAAGQPKYQVYAKADEIAANYGATVNPIWQDYWTGHESTNKRQQVVAQIGAMLSDPSTPHTPTAVHLAYLYNLYQQFHGEKTTGAYTSAELKAQWGAAMNDFVAKYPDQKTVVQTVFLGLG